MTPKHVEWNGNLYSDYKGDKAINLKSGSNRSNKCRWYELVDEIMSDRANVVSHAHNTILKPSGIELLGAYTEEESNQGESSGSAKKRKKLKIF